MATKMKEQAAFPLSWPAGWPRTKSAERVGGNFTGTLDKVRRELLAEIDRIALGDRAFTGFLALPAPGDKPAENCWTVLGLSPGSSRAQIEAAYRALAKVHHPDLLSGDRHQMALINAAREAALILATR